MKKRGATVVNFVLILALLIIGFFVMLSLRKMIFWQGSQLEQDMTNSFVEKIVDTIEIAKSYPGGAQYKITFDEIYDYRLTLKRNVITVYFPRLKKTISKNYIVSNINVLPSTIENAGEFYVVIAQNTLFLTTKIKCNTSDDVCDPGCLIKDICDKKCYANNEYDVCIGKCVDSDRNTLFDRNDADLICDPDCYNNFRNGGVYDFDCLKSDDGICDPDTHFVYDGYCDTDCIPSNGICDPDCGDRDLDCYSKANCNLDRKENCKNSFACRNCTSLMSDGQEWNCKYGCENVFTQVNEYGCIPKHFLKSKNEICYDDCECQEGYWCDGICCKEGQRNVDGHCKDPNDDKVCDFSIGENCITAPKDCLCKRPGHTNTGGACCPNADKSSVDEWGCSSASSQGYNQVCTCSSQCDNKRLCVGDTTVPNGAKCCDEHEYIESGNCHKEDRNGDCQYEYPQFEDCTWSSDCACSPDACCPEDPSAGPAGCAQSGIKKEELCYCAGQCANPLYCSGELGDKHCCDTYEVWNGTACQDKSQLKILFVPISIDDSKLTANANSIVNYLKKKLPHKISGGPISITPILMTQSQFDKWNSEALLASHWNDMCGKALEDMLSLGKWYKQTYKKIDYDYIMGICPKGNLCKVLDKGTLETKGCAHFKGIASIIKLGGTKNKDPRVIAAHELGHNFGLSHVDAGCGELGYCFGANKKDCDNPLAQKQKDVMSYCAKNPEAYSYGPAAKRYIKEKPLFTQVNAP